MPIPNSNRSYESIQWNGATIYPSNKNQDWAKLTDKQSRNIRIYNSYCVTEVELKNKFDKKHSESLNNLNEIADGGTMKRVQSIVSLPIKNSVLLSKRSKINSLRI